MDLIDRQSAIDALENDKEGLNKIIMRTGPNDVQFDHYVAQYNQVVHDIDAIKGLPSAQPEYDLDGYSSRFWEAAYERGKQDAEAEYCLKKAWRL